MIDVERVTGPIYPVTTTTARTGEPRIPSTESRVPVVLSWSGGKDSALALEALRASPDLEIVSLLTSVTTGYERISIHGVRRELLRAQAESLGIPLHELEIPAQCSNEIYDAAVATALADLRRRHPALRRIAYGDLFLERSEEHTS